MKNTWQTDRCYNAAMNPEWAAINKIDAEKRPDHIKRTAEQLLPLHPQVETTLEKISLKLEDFSDLYGEDVIAKDQAHVESLKQAFANKRNISFIEGLTEGDVKKLSEILEFQIIKGFNVGRWIPFCRAIKTSEFDDFVNGVDMVVEFQKSEQYGHFGMGVDISFSHQLQHKFERIKKEIDSYDGKAHRLGRVKYFNSPQTGIRGELSGLPRVVVALDVGVMEDLAHTKGDGYANHIARHAVILEIEHQLAVFADYASKHNKACLDQILRTQNLIHAISLHMASEQKLDASEYRKNRKIQESIERGLDMFRR